MHQNGRAPRYTSTGFTLVELILVIVIIGILAAITTVTYTGFQRRAAAVTAQSDLVNVSKTMELEYARNSTYPNSIPSTFRPSPNIDLSITTSSAGERYENLSAIQNGVLFHDVCNQVLDDEYEPGLHYGTGRNNGNQVEVYIDYCHPQYGPNQWQLQGWGGQSAGTYSIPVTEAFMQNKMTTISYSDSWRPNRAAVEMAFWNEFYSRYTSAGGQFPVTSFWNPNYGCETSNPSNCWNLPP